MKKFILQFLILGLATVAFADETNFPVTTNQTSDIEQKLAAYENGTLSLDELTVGSNDKCQEIIDYYFAHPNDISVKAKLPISRCLAAAGEYQVAIRLASEYVQVYSNDWHGWKIVGGANIKLHKLELAIEPLTKAVNLGDDYSCVSLGLAALGLERLDIVSNMVSHLMVLKNQKPAPEGSSLDIVTVLTLYSVKADQQDIFVKALAGLSAKQILSRDDLPVLVRSGCAGFRGKEIDKIRQELESATNSTNSISSPPR